MTYQNPVGASLLWLPLWTLYNCKHFFHGPPLCQSGSNKGSFGTHQYHHMRCRNQAQLLLYTGKADSQSLDSVLLSRQSRLEGHIIALDIKRAEDQDILSGDLYSQLCVSAWNGEIQGTGGGPNCRTWSILRWFPKPGFPKPVRGRQEPDCWGFLVLEASEANDTDNDSLLLLRQLLLSHISKMRYKGPGLPWCFLEHPEDPKLCSTSPSANGKVCTAPTRSTNVHQE